MLGCLLRRLLRLWLRLCLLLVSLAAVAWSCIVALLASTLVVKLALTSVLSLVALVLLITLRAIKLTTLATHLVHTAWTSKVSGRTGEHIAQEVLLHLLEATLLALLVQFLCRHPKLDREWARAERRRLVKSLNRAFSALNVLVENEVLPVGSLWVEILALA